jgi:hypothetical protein
LLKQRRDVEAEDKAQFSLTVAALADRHLVNQCLDNPALGLELLPLLRICPGLAVEPGKPDAYFTLVFPRLSFPPVQVRKTHGFVKSVRTRFRLN